MTAALTVRALTPKEEYEQYVWGVSMMTPEEKTWAKEEQKTIDEIQLEFAREQMKKKREFKSLTNRIVYCTLEGKG